MVDERRHMERLQRSLGELRIAIADVASGARRRHARDHPPQPRARRHRLPAGHPRRGPARSCLSAARHRAEHRRHGPQSRHGGQRARGREGIAVITVPDNRWARVDIKAVALLPNVLAKQAARERGAKRSLVCRPRGLCHRGLLDQCLDRDRGGQGASPGRPIAASCAASPERVLIDAIEAQGLALEERPFTVAEAYAAREAFVTAASQIVMPVVRIDGRPIGDGAPGPVADALTDGPSISQAEWALILGGNRAISGTMYPQLVLARLANVPCNSTGPDPRQQKAKKRGRATWQ